MALAWPQIYVYNSLNIAACMEDTSAATKIEAKIPEEAMRKSLILALTAIGGGVGYAAGVTEVATGPTTDDSSTWRWHVSSILAAQGNTTSHGMETVGVLGAEAFNQRYERYTPLGLPQPRGDLR
jgi:hypothetical protein